MEDEQHGKFWPCSGISGQSEADGGGFSAFCESEPEVLWGFVPCDDFGGVPGAGRQLFGDQESVLQGEVGLGGATFTGGCQQSDFAACSGGGGECGRGQVGGRRG